MKAIRHEIKCFVKTNYVGSKVEETISVFVDENATDDEIEEAKEIAAKNWLFDNIDWDFSDVN